MIAPMLSPMLSIAMSCVAFACAGMAIVTWRNPNNWHLDGESERVEFHRWTDLATYGAIGALCLITSALAFIG